MRKCIKIKGMYSRKCALAIEEILSDLGGKNIFVDALDEYALADISADDEDIIDAIEEEGFDVYEITTDNR